jgi:ribosomal protein L29
MMKASDLRENTEAELVQMCDEKKKALAEMNVKSIIGEAAEQPLMKRYLRRDIARINTVMNEMADQKKGSA